MGEVSLLLIDVDGVLTNGEVFVDSAGNRSKVFNARDSRAIAQLVSEGWEVHVVSTSGWPGLAKYLERSPAIVWSDFQKTPENLERITLGRPYVAVGDDVWDIHMLLGATIALCPQDADAAVLALGCVVPLPVCGGRGVIAEILRYFEKIQCSGKRGISVRVPQGGFDNL